MHARGALRRQPGSRSEVFTSRDLSAADKRALMRALKTVSDAAAPTESTGEAQDAPPAPLPPPFDDGAASFTAVLAAAGLSPELRAAALHALALRDADVTCAEGVAALQRRVTAAFGLLERLARADAPSHAAIWPRWAATARRAPFWGRCTARLSCRKPSVAPRYAPCQPQCV